MSEDFARHVQRKGNIAGKHRGWKERLLFKIIFDKSFNQVDYSIPKNYSSAHINLSNEPSIIMALVNPSWKPDNRDEHNVTYDDYDWNKWNKYLS